MASLIFCFVHSICQLKSCIFKICVYDTFSYQHFVLCFVGCVFVHLISELSSCALAEREVRE